jgi:hypothetical protein
MKIGYRGKIGPCRTSCRRRQQGQESKHQGERVVFGHNLRGGFFLIFRIGPPDKTTFTEEKFSKKNNSGLFTDGLGFCPEITSVLVFYPVQFRRVPA